MLSGYRLMWILVMFDLPVGTKAQRKAAMKFRTFLLDEGFDMCQFSVYLRFCPTRERIRGHLRRIQQALPEAGLVQMLSFTDKQYENIITFEGRRRGPDLKNPEQYELF